MARIDTLNNFLTDVADSIRTKKGTTEPILASEFDTEIESIETSEDLSDELNTYDSELTKQSLSLSQITSALINKASGSGSSQINVFLQSEEPNIKHGVWIKQDELINNGLYINPKVSSIDTSKIEYNYKTNMPNNAREIGCCSIGNCIYYFGGNSGSYLNQAYKYDTLTDTYTKLTNLPYSAYGIGCVPYKTDIYLFGGRGSSYYSYTYKYDTLTDTYTKLTNIPSTAGQMGIAIKEDDVYIIGGGSHTKKTYKYNITTDTYTELADYPKTINSQATAIVKNRIYSFGGYSGSTTSLSYVYDILSDTYSSILSLPFSGYGQVATTQDNIIYIFGGGSESGGNKVYAYNIDSNDYELASNMPFSGGRLSIAKVDNKAYLLGGIIISDASSSNYSNTMIEVTLPETAYININNNSVLMICSSNTYETLILNNINVSFSDAFYYSDKKEYYETYYGNGEEWIKIR